MFQGLEHAAIATPDPEKLAKWYVETLGFTVNYFSATSKTTFVKAPNGSMFEIIASQGERQAASMKTPGLRHFAITTTDFPAACAALKEKGVAFLTEPDTKKGVSTVFFTDPDGNILHLIQREKPLP
jgi:catechol 2,3-dioxygenase-like lactoylglutathione lyase family enzyme